MQYVGKVLAAPLLWTEKRDIILLNVFHEIPSNEAECLQGVLDFYFCGEPIDGNEPAPKEPVLDWEKDALRIWGDFRVYAGIDLSTTRMHWWQFMAIFRSLPSESQIKFAIAYRGMDLSEIKDAKTRAQYAKIKRAVALQAVDYEAEYDEAMERRNMNVGNSV